MTEKILTKILIGDDDVEIVASLSRFLKSPTLEIDIAYTPQDVINNARQKSYDKIVTDLDYTEGGEEGYQVLNQVRELAPVKVLYTSKAYSEKVKERAYKEGATHLIPKSNMSDLIKLLKEERK